MLLFTSIASLQTIRLSLPQFRLRPSVTNGNDRGGDRIPNTIAYSQRLRMDQQRQSKLDTDRAFLEAKVKELKAQLTRRDAEIRELRQEKLCRDFKQGERVLL